MPPDPRVLLRQRGGGFRSPWHASRQVLAGSQRHSTPTRGVYMTDWIEHKITAPRRRTPRRSQLRLGQHTLHCPAQEQTSLGILASDRFPTRAAQHILAVRDSPRHGSAEEPWAALAVQTCSLVLLRATLLGVRWVTLADPKKATIGSRSARPRAIEFSAPSRSDSSHPVRLAEPGTTDVSGPPETPGLEDRPLNSAE